MSHKLRKDKFITEKEAQHLEKLCLRSLDDVGACFVLLVHYTGARTQEVLNIRQSNLSENSVYIEGLKGSNDREIPLPAKFFKRLKELPDKPFDVHRSTAIRWWDLYRPRPDRGLHSLRHTLALRLYKQTKDIRLVKYMLGHKNIQNTMVYADYAYSQEELTKVLSGTRSKAS